MAEYDCIKCKMWKGCPGKHWYDYLDIRWCPQQCIWILQNKDALDAGIYPEQYRGHSKQLRAEGYFVKAKIIIGELKGRLDRTPDKGEILITQIEDGRTLDKSTGKPLSPGAYEILMYVKGRDPKIQKFSDWQRQRRYNKKILRKRRKATIDKQKSNVLPY